MSNHQLVVDQVSTVAGSLANEFRVMATRLNVFMEDFDRKAIESTARGKLLLHSLNNPVSPIHRGRLMMLGNKATRLARGLGMKSRLPPAMPLLGENSCFTTARWCWQSADWCGLVRRNGRVKSVPMTGFLKSPTEVEARGVALLGTVGRQAQSEGGGEFFASLLQGFIDMDSVPWLVFADWCLERGHLLWEEIARQTAASFFIK